MRDRTDESENACASLVLSKWGQILPANEKVSWFSIKMPQRAGQELVFNQNESRMLENVTQEKLFSCFHVSLHEEAHHHLMIISEPIKKHKTSAQSVIAYPKECSSGIIGRGMNNATDSSPVSDLRGKNANKAIFRYQFQQNRVNQLIALGLRMTK